MGDELSVMRDTLNGLARLLTKSSAEDRPAIMAMIKNAEASIASMRAKTLTPAQRKRQDDVDRYLDMFRRADHPIAREMVEAVEKLTAPSSIDVIFMVTSILMRHVARLENGKGQAPTASSASNGTLGGKPNGKPSRSVMGVQHKDDSWAKSSPASKEPLQ